MAGVAHLKVSPHSALGSSHWSTKLQGVGSLALHFPLNRTSPAVILSFYLLYLWFLKKLVSHVQSSF